MNLHNSCTLSILYRCLQMFNAIKYQYKLNSHDIPNSFIVTIIYNIYMYLYLYIYNYLYIFIFIYIYICKKNPFWIPTIPWIFANSKGEKNKTVSRFQAGDDDEEATWCHILGWSFDVEWWKSLMDHSPKARHIIFNLGAFDGFQ